MRVRRILTVALGIAFLLSTGIAGATVPIQTVVTFNPTAGEFPEGVAVDARGTVSVSLINPVGEIRRFGSDGSESVLAHFAVPGFGPLGLAVDAAGNLYAAVASFDPSSEGVYRVRPDGTSTRLPGTGGMLFPNGIALDPRGTVYATDSISGAVWRIPRGGSAQVWIQDPLLQGNGSAGLGFPLGANGIAVRNDSVIVANTEGSRIVRIPVKSDGTAGTPSVVAAGTALFGADGIALDVLGNTYVAVNPQSTFLRVRPNGSIATLATAADGLNNPASLAFGTSMGDRKSLYITNFSVFSATPTPALLKANVGVPGFPLT